MLASARSHWPCLCCLAISIVAAPASSLGQKTSGQAAATDDDASSSSLVVGGRQEQRELLAIREQLDQGRFLAAARELSRMLSDQQNVLIRAEGSARSYRSLRGVIEDLIANGPDQLIEAIQQVDGAAASAALQTAVSARDLERVQKVEQRYFFTREGTDAAALLARHWWSQGRFQEAARYWEKLLALKRGSREEQGLYRLQLAVAQQMMGDTSGAANQIAALRDSGPWDFSVGVQVLTFDGDEDTADTWLQEMNPGPRAIEHHVWQGDVRGSEQTAAEIPWDVRVAFETDFDGPFSKTVHRVIRQLRLKHSVQIPIARPVIADGALIVRRPAGVVAFDIKSGRVRWRVEAAAPLKDLSGSASPVQLTESRLDELVAARLFGDMTWGAVSTDGQTVFVVEDWAFDTGIDMQAAIIRLRKSGRTEELIRVNYSETRTDPATELALQDEIALEKAKRSNTLSAYDLRSGKLLWQIGGFSSVASLECVRFLGPPLPVFGHLYVVAENTDRLPVLMTITPDGVIVGSLVLGVTLANEVDPSPFGTPLLDFGSTVRAAPPIFAAGSIICITRDRQCVAIDPLDGTHRWIFRLPLGHQPRSRDEYLKAVERMKLELSAPDRWLGSEAIVCGERVLLTYDTLDELYGIDVRTGELCWSMAREDGMFVKRVNDRQAIIVGRSSLRGIDVDAGDTLWSCDYPRGVVPSGRGACCGDAFCMPLSSGEIAVIDVPSGQWIGEIIRKDPSRLGHLVTYRDNIYSVGADTIERLSTISGAQATLAAEGESQPVADLVRLDLAKGDFEAALRRLREQWQEEAGPSVELIALSFRTLVHAIRRQPTGYAAEIAQAARLTCRGNKDTLACIDLAQLLLELGRTDDAARLADSLPSANWGSREIAAAEVGRWVRLDRQVAGLRQEVGGNAPAAQDRSPLPIERAESDFRDGGVSLDLRRDLLLLEIRDEDPDEHEEEWSNFDVASVQVIGNNPSHLQLNYNTKTGTLWGLNRYGMEILRITLPTVEIEYPIRHDVPQHFQAIISGSVVVMHRGDAIFAVSLEARSDSLLWSEQLATEDTESKAISFFFLKDIQEAKLQWKPPGSVWTKPKQASNPRLIAAAETGAVYFQRARTLRCVDLNNGELIWSRDDFPTICDLHVSEDRIVATPILGETARVVSSLDGRFLYNVPALKLSERVGFFGSNVLQASGEEPGRAESAHPFGRDLALVNPVNGELLWQLRTSPDPLIGFRDGAIAVLTQEGKLDIYAADSGTLRWSFDLSPVNEPVNLYLMKYDDVLVVAVDERRGFRSRAWNNGFAQLTGHLFGINLADGEVLWRYETEEGSTLRWDQPSGLPLIVLGGHYPAPISTKKENPQAAVLSCLDVRNGRVLEKSRVVMGGQWVPESGYRLVFDAADRTARLETPRRTVIVTFLNDTSTSAENENSP